MWSEEGAYCTLIEQGWCHPNTLNYHSPYLQVIPPIGSETSVLIRETWSKSEGIITPFALRSSAMAYDFRDSYCDQHSQLPPSPSHFLTVLPHLFCDRYRTSMMSPIGHNDIRFNLGPGHHQWSTIHRIGRGNIYYYIQEVSRTKFYDAFILEVLLKTPHGPEHMTQI